MKITRAQNIVRITIRHLTFILILGGCTSTPYQADAMRWYVDKYYQTNGFTRQGSVPTMARQREATQPVYMMQAPVQEYNYFGRPQSPGNYFGR